MVLFLPLLPCESAVFVEKTLIEKKIEKTIFDFGKEASILETKLQIWSTITILKRNFDSGNKPLILETKDIFN